MFVKVWLFAILGLLLLAVASCAHTEAGLKREQAVYRVGTNGLAMVDHYVVSAMPEPWRDALQAVTGLAAAGLAAWNTSQHKRIVALETTRRTTRATGPPAE